MPICKRNYLPASNTNRTHLTANRADLSKKVTGSRCFNSMLSSSSVYFPCVLANLWIDYVEADEQTIFKQSGRYIVEISLCIVSRTYMYSLAHVPIPRGCVLNFPFAAKGNTISSSLLLREATAASIATMNRSKSTELAPILV